MYRGHFGNTGKFAIGACAAVAVWSAAFTTAAGATSGSSGGSASTNVVAPPADYAPQPANTPKPNPLSTNTNVTICVPAKIENFATLPVAVSKGEFTKENLNANVVVDPGGANSETQELAQGTCQVVVSGVGASQLNSVHSGVPIQYVGVQEFPNPNDKAGFWIQKSYLTKNKTLNKSMASSCKMMGGAAGIGSPPVAQAQLWLQQSGLSVHDLPQETLDAASTVQAMQNGALCFADLSSPFWTTLSSDKDVTPILVPNWPSGMIAMYGPWASSHKAEAQAILRAMIRTDRTYLGSNYRKNASVMSIISNWVQVPVSTIDQTKPIYFSTNLSPDVLTSLIPALQNGWIQIGSVLQYTTPIKASTLVNASYQKEAVK